MASFIVEGNHSLHGEIIPQGAKNEALQVICATLLTTDEVVIENVPDILDVNNLIHLLGDMGVTVKHQGTDTYSFKAEHIDTDYIDSQDFTDKCARLRGSVMLIGPLLSRLGKMHFATPGGDKIGRRRLDTHFRGICNLGAEYAFDAEKKAYTFESKGRLQGAYMLLDEASVTGMPHAEPDGCQDIGHRLQPADHRGCGRTARGAPPHSARHD